MNTEHPWTWAHKPTGQKRWLAYTLGGVYYFPKPYGSTKFSSSNIYTNPQPTILSMWNLVSYVKYFQHSLSHVSHIIPRTIFRSNTILVHDNSSHNLTGALLVWTQDTHELEPTIPRVKSVDLHIHLIRFIVSQNHMIGGSLAHPIYMQVHKPLFYRCGI